MGSSYNHGLPLTHADSCLGSLHDRNGRGSQLIVERSLTLWLGLSVNHSGEAVTGDEKRGGSVIVQSKVDQKWGKSGSSYNQGGLIFGSIQ